MAANYVKAKSVWTRFQKYIPQGLSADECWPWQGSRHKTGYGQLSDKPNRTVLKAHRIAYEKAYGPIPEGRMICHRCDNPPCCNPAHLYAGTARDNARDSIARGRASPPPLMRGEDCGMARLKEWQAREIKNSNEPGTVLAQKFGVAATTICAIRKGVNWRHL
jgi:hypothetical protein